jgi:dihydroorotate dehydrogenase electron transfer subunit
MEEKMACGVGVCLGCPVKVKAGGYKMVCKDGPVFDAKEIAW